MSQFSFQKEPLDRDKKFDQNKKAAENPDFSRVEKRKKYPLGWLTKPEKLLYNKPCQKINKKVGGTGI